MKKYILISIVTAIISMIACSKLSHDQEETLANKVSELKMDSLTYYYDSILQNSQNYVGLVNASKELTQALINSNISYSQYSYYILNDKVDSVYIVANITAHDQAKYDTIFVYYAKKLLIEVGEDPINYSSCITCDSKQDKLDEFEGLWEEYENNPSFVSASFQSLLPSGGGYGCSNPLGYAICCGACVLTFGEMPPLCIACIYLCACQYCPSQYLGCAYIGADQ